MVEGHPTRVIYHKVYNVFEDQSWFGVRPRVRHLRSHPAARPSSVPVCPKVCTGHVLCGYKTESPEKAAANHGVASGRASETSTVSKKVFYLKAMSGFRT